VTREKFIYLAANYTELHTVVVFNFIFVTYLAFAYFKAHAEPFRAGTILFAGAWH